MFGGLCNIEGALYDLLSDKVLVERLPLAPQDQEATLRLEVGGGGRQRGEVGGDGRVPGLLGGSQTVREIKEKRERDLPQEREGPCQ